MPGLNLIVVRPSRVGLRSIGDDDTNAKGMYRTKSPRSIVKLAGREDFIYWAAKRTWEKIRSTLSQSADFWEAVSHHLQKSC